MPSCPPAPGARARPACGPRPSQPRCPACRAGILEPLIADDRRSSRRRWTRRPCEVPASSSVVTARSPSREAPAEPPASGSPAPLNFRSNTGPPPPQNRFAGAAITARPRQFGRGGAGKAFVLHAQRRFSWRGAGGGPVAAGCAGRCAPRSPAPPGHPAHIAQGVVRWSCWTRTITARLGMLFDYLVIRILNPSYRPSGAAGDLHTRVPRKCAAFLPPERLRLRAAGAPSMWGA